MNPFEMVVMIVAIVGISSVLKARYGVVNRGKGEELIRPAADDKENQRLRDELRSLKERVAVLERIATDGNSGAQLDREIEALRHRD